MAANIAHDKAPDFSLIQTVGEEQDPVSISRLYIHTQCTCLIYIRSGSSVILENMKYMSLCCLTWVMSTHVVPEIDTLGVSHTTAYRRGQSRHTALGKGIHTAVGQHVVT